MSEVRSQRARQKKREIRKEEKARDQKVRRREGKKKTEVNNILPLQSKIINHKSSIPLNCPDLNLT